MQRITILLGLLTVWEGSEAYYIAGRTTVGGEKSNVFNIYFGDNHYSQKVDIVADPSELIIVTYDNGETDEMLPTSIVAKHVLKELQNQIILATKANDTERVEHLLEMQVVWDDARRSYLEQEINIKMTAREERLKLLEQSTSTQTPRAAPVSTTSPTNMAPTMTAGSGVSGADQSGTSSTIHKGTSISYIMSAKAYLYQRGTTIVLFIDCLLLCILCGILYADKHNYTFRKNLCLVKPEKLISYSTMHVSQV